MKAELHLEEFKDQSCFRGLVEHGIDWHASQPDNLCVLVTSRGLGYLAIAGEPSYVCENQPPSVSAVLFMSDRLVSESELLVPSTCAMLIAQGEKDTYKGDGLAYGRGVLGTNVPKALVRGHSDERLAAVRKLVLPLGGMDIYVGPGSDSFASRSFRRAKHGVAYLGALAEDAVLGGRHAIDRDVVSKPGTDRAVARRERKYEDAICALLPLSPSWFAYQAKHGITYPDNVRAGHVLANGTVLQGSLVRLGTSKIPHV